MSLEKAHIYPVEISHGNVLAEFGDEAMIAFQEIIENTSPDTHGNLQKPQSEPAITDDGLFMHEVGSIKQLKEMFEQQAIELHESKFPNLKGKLRIYDSVAKGIVINHNTTVQQTMSNHPWTYTGILVCRVPPNLPRGQGDVVFIDHSPVSDLNDTYGLVTEKGNMTIFPGWLKYRLRPISLEQGTYDTVMMIIMNTMIVHETLNEHVEKETEKWRQEYNISSGDELDIDDLDHLGPSNTNPGEIDIGEI
jgi:hypothetical protein